MAKIVSAPSAVNAEVLNVADLADVGSKTGTGTVVVMQTAPVLITPKIQDSDASHNYELAVSNLAANRTITLPLLTGGDTFVFEAFAATLTNKTLGSGTVFGASPTGNGVTQWVEVSITNAEMLALRAAPKQLVAAPGAGKILEFVQAILLFDYTAAYTETDDNMAVKYENGSGVKVSEDIETTGFVDATADTITTAPAVKDAITAKTGCENKALVLHNIGGDEFGGGNAANAVRVKVAYRVWSTGF